LGAVLHGQAVGTQKDFFSGHGDVGQQSEAISAGGSGLPRLPGKIQGLLSCALPVVIASGLAQLIAGSPKLRLIGSNDRQPFVDGIQLNGVLNAQESGVERSTVAVRLVKVPPFGVHLEALVRHLGEIGGTDGDGFLAGHLIKLAIGQGNQCETN